MTSPRLGDYHLQLDPALEAEILSLRSAPPSSRLRNLVLFPKWVAFDPPTLNRILLAPPATPSQPVVPRGDGPAVPRAADVGDLLEAIWKVPVVQQTATRVLDQASQRARHDWRSASSGDRALFITTTAVISGGTLAGVLSSNDARASAFGLIVNRDIPVPGVDGLTVKVKPRGGAASYSNIAGSGVSVSAAAQAGAGGQAPQVEVMVTLDLARYLR